MDNQLTLLKKIIENEGGTPHLDLKADPPIQVKTFQWGQLNVGDDQMNAGSTLTLWSNGTGRFDAQTLCYSTHSGDTWHHWITLYDLNSNPILGLGYFDSPRMDDGNPPPVYTWSAGFTFDPTLFNSAVKATAFYSA